MNDPRKTKQGLVFARLVALGLVTALTGIGQTPADAQVLPNIQDPLRRPLDGLERARERAAERARREAEAAEQAARAAAAEGGETVNEAAETAGDVAAQAGQVVNDASGVAGQVAGSATQAVRAPRTFELAAAPGGWPIEARTVVALLTNAERETLQQTGLIVVSERPMPRLGRTLVTFREPTAAPLETTLDTIRSNWPQAPADYNHLYRLQFAQGASDEPANVPNAGADSGLRIGLIDSAVEPTHFSVQNVAMQQQSFVTHEGREPVSHGTAVASILARAAGESDVEILSASVFFQAPNYAPGATTESLVAALDWLAGSDVQVINMSLAGPENALLQAALEAIAADGPPVVAAVGNNGPSGEALYPAAYPGVIGVTAVDRERKVWLYANRGDYVDFAALGVNVKVADAGAGWRIESGTSMASPLIAMIVATMNAREKAGTADIVERLAASAEDLGRTGFDPEYGFGLVTRPPELLTRQQR